MVQKPKPVIRRRNIKDCEACLHKSGDFFMDKEDPNVIRLYCKARHTEVNVELMVGNCDFFTLNPEYSRPEEAKNKYGL